MITADQQAQVDAIKQKYNYKPAAAAKPQDDWFSATTPKPQLPVDHGVAADVLIGEGKTAAQFAGQADVLGTMSRLEKGDTTVGKGNLPALLNTANPLGSMKSMAGENPSFTGSPAEMTPSTTPDWSGQSPAQRAQALEPSNYAQKVGSVATVVAANVAPVGAIAMPRIKAEIVPGINKGISAAKGVLSEAPNPIDSLRGYADTSIKAGIESDVASLLKSTKSLSKKSAEAGARGTDFKKILSDPQVFKGLKVENGKINPDEAIQVIEDRIQPLLDAKQAILPKIDGMVSTIHKGTLLRRAIEDIQGKYAPADEAALVRRIRAQVDALPEMLKPSQLDRLRAQFRLSARDAKGQMKSESEYAALENASRDIVFDVTDNLPIKNASEYKALNDYVKQMIQTEDLLNGPLRGQTVKGGRAGNITGRLIGAVVGSSHGPIGTLAGSVGGGVVADIITNNALGSSFKMSLIRNITSDPAILAQAEQILRDASNQSVIHLPSRSPAIDTAATITKSSNIIKSDNTTTPAPEVKPPQHSSESGFIKNPFAEEKPAGSDYAGYADENAAGNGKYSAGTPDPHIMVQNYVKTFQDMMGEMSNAQLEKLGGDKALIQRLRTNIVDGLNHEGNTMTPVLRQIADIQPKDIYDFITQLKNLPKAPGAAPKTDGMKINWQAGFVKNPLAPSPFKGFSDLTTTLLDDLKGRAIVSKQYLLDATNRPELKQPERDLFRTLLADEGKNINAIKFANKVKTELLPLERNAPKVGESARSGGVENTRYENITLPDELRGPVANYSEHVYESPINTSAGQKHFGNSFDKGNPGYFAHTRIEDLPPKGIDKGINRTAGNGISNEYAADLEKYAKQGDTRRVIELQSDLFQKGRLEVESRHADEILNNPTYAETAEARAGFKNPEAHAAIVNDAKARRAEVAKLEPYRNTWQERVIREEVKQAAKDGKTKLQFPTGETAMKIEGLVNRADKWVTLDNQLVDGTNIKEGDLITYQTHEGTPHPDRRFLVVKNRGDGTFDAVDGMTAENDADFYNILERKNLLDDGRVPSLEELQNTGALNDKEVIADLRGMSEHLSAKDVVDKEDPIFKFYEKEVARYLKNAFGATLITDPQGVTWNQVNVPKEAANQPVQVYKNTQTENQADQKPILFTDRAWAMIKRNARFSTAPLTKNIGGQTAEYPGLNDVFQKPSDRMTYPQNEVVIDPNQDPTGSFQHENFNVLFNRLNITPQAFNHAWETEKKTNPILQYYDDALIAAEQDPATIKSRAIDKAGGKIAGDVRKEPHSLASERFALAGRTYGPKGLDNFPEPLRKFYENIIQGSKTAPFK